MRTPSIPRFGPLCRPPVRPLLAHPPESHPLALDELPGLLVFPCGQHHVLDGDSRALRMFHEVLQIDRQRGCGPCATRGGMHGRARAAACVAAVCSFVTQPRQRHQQNAARRALQGQRALHGQGGQALNVQEQIAHCCSSVAGGAASSAGGEESCEWHGSSQSASGGSGKGSCHQGGRFVLSCAHYQTTCGPHAYFIRRKTV